MPFLVIFLYSCTFDRFSCDSNNHAAGISTHLAFFAKVLISARVANKRAYVPKLAEHLSKHTVLISAHVDNERTHAQRVPSSMHASKTGRGSGHFIQTKSAHVKHSVGNLFCSNTQFFLYKKLGSGNEYSVSYRINPNIRACPYKRKLGKSAHNSNIRACPSVRVKFFFFINHVPNFRI